jgi:Protein of unknown function (DUF2637)
MTVMAKHARLSAAWALLSENPVLFLIAGIGFSVSFQTIARLALQQHMPGYPVLYPLLIDLGILALIIEARKAIDDGRSDLVPRVLAWVLAAFTIYVNAHGSPAGDWLGIALHVTAPALWVVFLELTRWRKLRRKRAEKGEGIPLSRWLADSPRRTLGMRRRMIVHNVTSYPEASAREEARLLAADLTRASLGKRWKREAPAVLRHHLKTGTLPAEVAMACSMASPGRQPAVAEPVERWVTEALEKQDKAVARVKARRLAAQAPHATPHATPQGTPAGAPAVAPSPRQKDARDAAAKRAKAKRIMAANPGLSNADVAAKAGVSGRTVSRVRGELPRQLRVAGE